MRLTVLYITIFALTLLSCGRAKREDAHRQLFQAEDFTAMNVFTNNIEGPCFDAQGKLYVVNFGQDGTIGVVDSAGGVQEFVKLPEGSTANSIQFDREGNMLLADFTGHNVLKVNMTTKEVSVYAHDDRFNQPNDICINARGQVFASDPNWKESTGQVWRIDTTGVATLLADSMGTANGICLSPDERALYVNESVQRNIWVFDVDETGNISNKRLLISFPDFGFDGMKCDAAGNLFVTRYGKGVVAVVSPAGDLLREIPLTGKSCSNLVFSPDGTTVYVTLQDRKGMERFYVAD